MKKSDLHINFIQANKESLVDSCIENARDCRDSSMLLIDNGHFSKAHSLCITGLEEIAKVKIIKSLTGSSSTSQLVDLINHNMKAREIVALAGGLNGIKPKDEIYNWGEQRIPQMKEDCLYTRLKPTPNDQFRPNDDYWKKRAESFYKLLDKLLE